MTDLGVFAALEEWCDTDKSYIVVPHDCVLFIVVWDLECILENCFSSQSGRRQKDEYILPSKLSRPVFSRKLFFSLL